MSEIFHKTTGLVVLLIGCLCTHFCTNARAESMQDIPTLNAGLSYESKYVSEGRNNLEDGGLFSFESCFGIDGFEFGAWFAIGETVNYQELNVSGEYLYELAGFDICVGYTRLEFLKDSESDNEINAGVAYTAFPWLIPSLNYVYSTEAEGSFVEISIMSEISILQERLTISPYIMEGFDFGYVTEEFDGQNNLQLGIEIAVSATDQIQITGYIAHSWAHEDVRREGLGDQTWAGIGVLLAF